MKLLINIGMAITAGLTCDGPSHTRICMGLIIFGIVCV